MVALPAANPRPIEHPPTSVTQTKRSFLAGWDRSSGLILQRWLAAFGCLNAASKLVWRRTVTGPKLSTPDRSHEGAADRLRLHPSRRLTAPVGGLDAS